VTPPYLCLGMVCHRWSGLVSRTPSSHELMQVQQQVVPLKNSLGEFVTKEEAREHITRVLAPEVVAIRREIQAAGRSLPNMSLQEGASASARASAGAGAGVDRVGSGGGMGGVEASSGVDASLRQAWSNVASQVAAVVKVGLFALWRSVFYFCFCSPPLSMLIL